MLHPSLAAVGGIELLDVALEDPLQPAGLVRGRIRLNFAHDVGTSQRTELLLNERTPPPAKAALAHTFRATTLPSPPPATVTSREFEFRQVAQAVYLVRGRVDGVETRLVTTAGAFTDPALDIHP